MNIHKGDNVKMLSGKDRGKTGKILAAFPRSGRVVVEGLNIVKRHTRARRQGQKGQVIATPRQVDVSSVMLVCGKCNAATRIGHRREGAQKIRVCKKCDSET